MILSSSGRVHYSSYTYDSHGRVIRTLLQVGDFKRDESKTYNERGDEEWKLMIGSDGERSEVRNFHKYDIPGNWTERTTINTDQPRDPNTQRRRLAYY
jgi:hypothetical protein